MSEDWSASGRCPECGGAVSWVPSYIVVQGGDTVETGNYRCLSCGAEGRQLERVVKHGRESIDPVKNLGPGTPTASPIIGKGRVTLNEIIKRLVKEVQEGKLSSHTPIRAEFLVSIHV